jgi:alpha-galactosidase
MKTLTCLVFILYSAFLYSQKFDGLAKTPPMGWNSWNKFGCDVSEKLIREAADAMVNSGMKDAGYTYVVIDDCWHGERDSLGFIHPDPKRFPSGMKALADYIHSKGLKFGIYSDAGWKTCGGKPGSRGREYQDATSYASWGVDYLKYDWCNTDSLKTQGAYLTMRNALFSAGRPIVFSLCEWGNSKPWEWAKDVGHLWRTTGDISPVFDSIVNHGDWFSLGVMQIIDKQVDIHQYAGPDHWNDPDMLEVGNGMSRVEDRSHFSMWCMLAAPLIAGNDMSNMSKQTSEILTNKNVIAIDQDPLGVEGFKIMSENGIETWAKPLQNGNWGICFLNRGKVEGSIATAWNKVMITDPISKQEFDGNKKVYSIKDVWSEQSIGTTEKDFMSKIAPHDVILLRLHPVK